MQKIHFEDRAVAFIDILGFKTIVDCAQETPDNLSVLQELITTLETAIPSHNSLLAVNFLGDLPAGKHLC